MGDFNPDRIGDALRLATVWMELATSGSSGCGIIELVLRDSASSGSKSERIIGESITNYLDLSATTHSPPATGASGGGREAIPRTNADVRPDHLLAQAKRVRLMTGFGS